MKICLSRDLADLAGADVARIAPHAEIVRLGIDGQFDGEPDGVEVLLFSVDIGTAPLAMAAAGKIIGDPALRWVQSPAASVDHPIWVELVRRGVRVSSAAGVHWEPIAQYIMTYVLEWHRSVARHQSQQAARDWGVILSDDLTAKTLGIVGLGGIGSATARIAKAFGMRVVAVRRSGVPDPNVDVLLSPERIGELLAEANYVVLCLPLNDETHHYIGAPELAAMRDDAVLINVARGGVVDEPALISALQEERIRGATLDVVSEEPLPKDAPLWTLPNCVLTPPDAGYSPRAGERLAALFLENLERFVRAESLRNEIGETDG
jgi:phosphoglycerate dehydrogenase-like enzyme